MLHVPRVKFSCQPKCLTQPDTNSRSSRLVGVMLIFTNQTLNVCERLANVYQKPTKNDRETTCHLQYKA